MIPCSSRALREPLLDLCKVKPYVLPNLEMGDRVGRVLSGPVIDKRNRDTNQVGEFLGLQ
jgi:hypothetical protein